MKLKYKIIAVLLLIIFSGGAGLLAGWKIFKPTLYLGANENELTISPTLPAIDSILPSPTEPAPDFLIEEEHEVIQEREQENEGTSTEMQELEELLQEIREARQ